MAGSAVWLRVAEQNPRVRANRLGWEKTQDDALAACAILDCMLVWLALILWLVCVGFGSGLFVFSRGCYHFKD